MSMTRVPDEGGSNHSLPSGVVISTLRSCEAQTERERERLKQGEYASRGLNRQIYFSSWADQHADEMHHSLLSVDAYITGVCSYTKN